MAGNFLDEQTGDLVKYLRDYGPISTLVGLGTDARIFAEAARQGAETPFVTFTQVDGRSPKHHGGTDTTENLALHLYAWGDLPSTARSLAKAVRDRLLAAGNTGADTIAGDGTRILVCNGGIVDSGVDPAKDSSDRKRFWVRVSVQMLIAE